MSENGLTITGYYAHSKEGKPRSEWQALEDHLLGVAKLTEKFAGSFGAGLWGYWAGLWHDLGKYSDTFQNYLLTVSNPDPHIADSIPKTDHSTAGAQHAVAYLNVLGHLLGYVISGHHAGLLDGINEGACFDKRLKKQVESWRGHVPDAFMEASNLDLPGFLKAALGRKDAFSVGFFTRMIFSCLVDADYLDTEAFIKPEVSLNRPEWPEDILVCMDKALTEHVAKFGIPLNIVNQQRAEVRECCLNAADKPHGLFSLTVPTGGGKTLASLAFALKHALGHGLDRIIYVIPFTSIVEQSADEFRKAMKNVNRDLEQDVILEHHSNLDPKKETETSRLSAENWDAPLIVTTSVQFYESLFSNKTSRCRKLHRLARSVIILDEVQTLPVDLLSPCLKALQELSRNYGSSVVLCTATQPAVHKREQFPIGLEDVIEIIPNPVQLYNALKRVNIVDLGTQSDAELVERIQAENRVLCIVNTRGHARTLYELLGETDEHFHLSALMCPAHRTEVLKKIKERLDKNKGDVCRVVSTQLVEAGVDIDFPVVFRSMAGIDSIAQAAGRCNRDGVLTSPGRTYVFRSEHTSSERFFSETANVTEQVLALHKDPLTLAAVENYFKLYYWDQNDRWDAKQIKQMFYVVNDQTLPFIFGFNRAANSFQLIENVGQPVIIPWRKEGCALCDRLRYAGDLPNQRLLQKLQRYTVQVPRREWDKHIGRTIELIGEHFPVLISPEINYSKHTGLMLGGDPTTPLFA